MLDDLQGGLPDGESSGRNLQLFVEFSDSKVGLADVGDQRQSNGAGVFFNGMGVSCRGFTASPDTTPEINFPAEV